LINGGISPRGSIDISAAKNSVLPILACCTMCKGTVVLHNIAPFGDILNMLSLLKDLGAKAEWDNGIATIDCSGINKWVVNASYANRIRASICLLGPLSTYGETIEIALPGGCNIGARPVDIHIAGMQKLGFDVEQGENLVCIPKSPKSNTIKLSMPSVGATQNLMMAACGIKGTTTILNAACEPEVQDLADFINLMGGNITGAGTPNIVIDGGVQLHGGQYTPIGDRIVAGTYLLTSALGLGGDVTTVGVNPMYCQATLKILQDMGCKIGVGKDWVRVQSDGRLQGIGHIKTRPFPGLATDMQAQLVVVLSLAKGKSIVYENMFENRFGHVSQLNKMGADITIKDNSLIINGVGKLAPQQLQATDLRCGAAMVVAGLAVDGLSTVDNVHFIDRGYFGIENDLKKLGLNVIRSE